MRVDLLPRAEGIALVFPLRGLTDGNIAKVSESFFVRFTDDKGERTLICVPKGYLSDGSSVPGVIPNGIMSRVTGITGSVVHDYLYETKLFPKDICDWIAGELWRQDEMVDITIRAWMLAGLDSDIARRIYDPDWEPLIPGDDVDD